MSTPLSVDAQNALKKAAAAHALSLVREGTILGVGTGSTVNALIDLLARDGWSARLRGTVSSSEASTSRLRAAGLTVLDLNEVTAIDQYIDGADESTRDRCLIKGGGAALTREKIVAAVASEFLCIIDQSKLVDRLGRFPLPVEVIPMARSYVQRQLQALGGQPVWRQNVVTDNGNHILDVHGLLIDDPRQLEARIDRIVGVVTVGLFAARPADKLIIGTPDGVQTI